MNEHGLTISANILHMSVYQPPSQGKISVSFIEFVPYILKHYKTVDQAVAALKHDLAFTNIVDVGLPRVHWSIHDVSGKSVVVEYLKVSSIPTQLFNFVPIAHATQNPSTIIADFFLFFLLILGCLFSGRHLYFKLQHTSSCCDDEVESVRNSGTVCLDGTHCKVVLCCLTTRSKSS
jgi:hypothetical protein